MSWVFSYIEGSREIINNYYPRMQDTAQLPLKISLCIEFFAKCVNTQTRILITVFAYLMQIHFLLPKAMKYKIWA